MGTSKVLFATELVGASKVFQTTSLVGTCKVMARCIGPSKVLDNYLLRSLYVRVRCWQGVQVSVRCSKTACYGACKYE